MPKAQDALFNRLAELGIDPNDDYWTLEMSPEFAGKFVVETYSPDSWLHCLDLGADKWCCYKGNTPWFNFDINERLPEGHSFLIQTWEPGP